MWALEHLRVCCGEREELTYIDKGIKYVANIIKNYKADTCELPPRSGKTIASTPQTPRLLSPSQPSGFTFNFVLTLETPTELWKQVPKARITNSETKTAVWGLDSQRFQSSRIPTHAR